MEKKCVSSPRVVVFPPENGFDFSGKPTTWLPLVVWSLVATLKSLEKGCKHPKCFFFKVFQGGADKNQEKKGCCFGWS